MSPRKFWLKSKTVLFHLAVTAAGSWTAIEAAFGNLRDSLTPQQMGLVLTAVGVVGVFLRLITKTPVSATNE